MRVWRNLPEKYLLSRRNVNSALGKKPRKHTFLMTMNVDQQRFVKMMKDEGAQLKKDNENLFSPVTLVWAKS